MIVAKLHAPAEPWGCDPPSEGYAAERTLTGTTEVGLFVAEAVQRMALDQEPGERRAITFTIEVER